MGRRAGEGVRWGSTGGCKKRLAGFFSPLPNIKQYKGNVLLLFFAAKTYSWEVRGEGGVGCQWPLILCSGQVSFSLSPIPVSCLKSYVHGPEMSRPRRPPR